MSPFSKKVVIFADLGSLLGTILEALGQLWHNKNTISFRAGFREFLEGREGARSMQDQRDS